MSKLAWIPVLFLVACLFAGIYGALHNQISYTVSPEYFTQFKFKPKENQLDKNQSSLYTSKLSLTKFRIVFIQTVSVPFH